MHGNLGIAFDYIIENAIGGSGPDVFNGNQSDNQLDGQAGDDILNGSLGIDGIRARTSFKSNQGRATQ